MKHTDRQTDRHDGNNDTILGYRTYLNKYKRLLKSALISAKARSLWCLTVHGREQGTQLKLAITFIPSFIYRRPVLIRDQVASSRILLIGSKVAADTLFNDTISDS